MCYGFRQCFSEFQKVFFVEEDLVLLVFVFTDALTLRDRDIEILLRLGGFHIKEVRSFPGANPLRENLIFVAIVIQGLRPPCKEIDNKWIM